MEALVPAPLTCRGVELDPEHIAGRLSAAGATDAAALARSCSFRFRPRPGGGTHLVTVCDDFDDPRIATVLDDALFHHLPFNTTRVLGGPPAVARAQPAPPALISAIDQEDPPPKPRVVALTSTSEEMVADIARLADTFALAIRQFRANGPTAAEDLATELRSLINDAALAGVLIARGGGDVPTLERLCTPSVGNSIRALRDAGKTVVVAFGHGTFHSGLDADFEAKVPALGAHALRELVHDHPERIKAVHHASQARLATAPLATWPALLDAERVALEAALSTAQAEHARVLLDLHQTPTR